jgi:DNA-binding LytR/AlgR family response regulator
MKWKCMLVDDEPPALNVLEKYISMVEQLELVAKCSNAFEALELLRTREVDLIFLDIQLPKLSGTSFLKTLTHPPKVIFTTAYKEYASEAFDLDAVDYLVKPVSLERFLRAINKVTKAKAPEPIQIAAPVNNSFLYFKVERKMVKVLLADISYVESIRDYIRIVRVNDKPLLVKQSMAALEAMLPGDLFIRVHRSFVVSINKVTAFTSRDIELGDMEIPIGKLYADRVKKFSGSFRPEE